MQSIEVSNLYKAFKPRLILEDISFTIAPGTVFGLVGANGAGKTTLIRLITGLLKPDTGSVRVLGSEPKEHDEHLFKRMGVVLEHSGFWDNMTFWQNLEFFGSVKGILRSEMNSYIQEYWPHLEFAKSNRKIKHLSRGEKVQCALCRAFIGWPEVCIFDEPTVNLDVHAHEHFIKMVGEAKRRGCTCLISSHQLSLIEAVCDTVGILSEKHLEIINTGMGNSLNSEWIITTGNSPEFGTAISEICGGELPRYVDGAWHVSVGEPGKMVPLIIQRLVSLGAAILEVRPANADLEERLKKMVMKQG